MPKMKSHSGAKKRFEITRTGKIRRRKAFMNHILEKKSANRKRRLGKMDVVAPGDAKNIKSLLGR
ncbi:MAG: large subunit ribosomal protein [Actinomycetota bacterium]|jgi:large subunit ribosomal protein L35|nr:large subunit ribosomal protein [Actinomycetota bacterium]